MNERNRNRKSRTGRFSAQVGMKATRKLSARNATNRAAYGGLRVFGLIGWSVVVPTLIGAAIGLWLDRHHPGARSWTLALLVAGLLLGCLNAWHWVDKEHREIKRQHDNDQHE